MQPLIFYGAGDYAKASLVRWLSIGLIPTCFSDSDAKKHYSKLMAGEMETEVLPLDEATSRYPDYRIVITAKLSWFQIYDSLLERGIPKERFFRYHAPSWCPKIGSTFIISGSSVQTCCEKSAVLLPWKGIFSDDYEQYSLYCQRLSCALQDGLFSTCENCHLLHDGIRDMAVKVEYLIISSGLPGGDVCNLRCCYCNNGNELPKLIREDNTLQILKQIDDFMQPVSISYSSGEITVSPYRDEIFSLWKEKEWRGKILTNAVIFSQDLADLLAARLVCTICSIDAGNRETFAKIKGADCFDRVLENLERYSTTGGRVILKFILLSEVNDTESEIEGFLIIAKKLHAEVTLSRDIRSWDRIMNESEYRLLQRFVELCREQEIVYSFIPHIFPGDLKRMKTDGLYKAIDMDSY